MVDLNSSQSLSDAIELMYFAYRGFTSRADKVLEGRGLGRVHHRILYFIGRNPNFTIGQLIETLAVSKQALNAPLRQLVEMNLVSQNADMNDRRIKRLLLTASGQRLETSLTGTQMAQLKNAFEAVEPKHVEVWYQVMKALSNPVVKNR